MTGTADQRIKRFVQKRAVGEKQVKEAAAEREAEIARAIAESGDALRLIDGVLKKIE